MFSRSIARRASGPNVYIVGGALTPFIGKGSPHYIDKKHPDFGKRENPTIEELTTTVVNDALKNCNVDAALIDRIAIGNFIGELMVKQGHLGAAVIGANAGKLMYKPTMRVEAACASGGLAVQVAHDAIKAGADVTLAVGVEIQTVEKPRVGGDYLARAAHYRRQRGIDDFTFPCLFARRMKAIAEANHFSPADAAYVAAKAYANANKNPLAHMYKKKMSYDDCNNVSESNPQFLGNEEYKPYLRVSDCSQVSDGGAAVILASEAGLKKLGISPTDSSKVALIKSLTCSTGNLYEDPADMTRMQTSHSAAQKALEQAGVKASDLEVAEVHDCFTIAEILMYEALGIAEYGKGKDLARNGDTTLDGRIPVNTGGGLIGFGHPVGATGVKQFVEVYRQMKGLCGDYQLKKIPKLGATLNMGGDDKTAVSSIIQNI